MRATPFQTHYTLDAGSLPEDFAPGDLIGYDLHVVPGYRGVPLVRRGDAGSSPPPSIPNVGQVVTLDDVAASIKRLGMAPGINELTKHLALAGLARGAPDADGAVLVRSAY